MTLESAQALYYLIASAAIVIGMLVFVALIVYWLVMQRRAKREGEQNMQRFHAETREAWDRFRNRTID